MPPETPVISTTVRCRDGELLRVYFTGEGPPLLLVHGWTLDRHSFDLQIPELSQALTVISYDRRGFGQSQAAPDLAADQNDIEDLLNALAVDSVHLLGVSQGGRLALRYAASRPERIRSLILQGAPLDGFVVDEPAAEQIPLGRYQAMAAAGQMAAVREDWLQHPLMSAGISDPTLARMLEDIVGEYRGADLTASSAPPPAVDLSAGLAELTAPAMVISGALETAGRRAHAERICELIPNAREIVLPYSGHLSNLSEAESYNLAVLSFCLGVETKR